jgi:hypothetical protein
VPSPSGSRWIFADGNFFPLLVCGRNRGTKGLVGSRTCAARPWFRNAARPAQARSASNRGIPLPATPRRMNGTTGWQTDQSSAIQGGRGVAEGNMSPAADSSGCRCDYVNLCFFIWKLGKDKSYEVKTRTGLRQARRALKLVGPRVS